MVSNIIELDMCIYLKVDLVKEIKKFQESLDKTDESS